MSAPSNAGSTNNKTQWSAMDLHGAPSGVSRFQQQQLGGYNTRSAAAAAAAASAASAMKVDDSGLSARNILIRRKLMERKRFDSADHAMKSAGAAAPAPPKISFFAPAADGNDPPPRATPAQVGASALFSALGADEVAVDATANVEMTAAAPDAAPASTSSVTAGDADRSMAQATAAAARGAGRYGGLAGPAGGAASARSILLQKKLREKKHFDSADYQLAQLKPAHAGATAAEAASVVSTDATDAAPMEIDPAPPATATTTNTTATAAAARGASINSPSAASLAARSRASAQMSPSVRGGKYGSAQAGANALLMRKLSEKKRFDSADYHMESGPAAAAHARKQQAAAAGATPSAGGAPTSFYVPAPSAAMGVAPPPAPSAAAPASGSKYGKLSAVNVLIRKKLKERKRFDSADYAMERQGRRQAAASASAAPQSQPPNDGAATSAGNVTMTDAEALPAATSVTPADEHNKSISHQVKHIKLSDGVGGWAAARVPSALAAAGGGAAAPKAGGAGGGSADSRLAARNLIIQRKLSERKRFDSADYFKEAASRGTR